MGKLHKRMRAISVMLLCLWILTGCGKLEEDTKIVLTTGFEKNEVFRIESSSCYANEVMVYLTNAQNQYSQTYGKEIWDMEKVENNLQQSIKESVLSELAEIKTMNLMAENYGIELDEERKELVDLAAGEYFASLNDTEKELMDVSVETIQSLYTEYALAESVYSQIIKDVNPEISDDEARSVTVEKLVIGYVSGSDADRMVSKSKMDEVLSRLEEGDDFEMLMTQYGERGTETISVSKDSDDAQLVEIAFDLGMDEVSEIIDSGDALYLVKCVSTFNKEETEANKINIVAERQREVFEQEYESFVSALTRNINKELWDSIDFLEDDRVTTASFFEVYEKYLK